MNATEKLIIPSAEEEREVWEFMTPLAWHNSVASKDSVFLDTYCATRQQIVETAISQGHDAIIEVGCGTGDVIGLMDTHIPRYGVDINEDFIGFCQKQHCSEDNKAKIGSGSLTFLIADALHLQDWWIAQQAKDGVSFRKPLVTCVNNTLNIMPEEMRGQVVAQMIAVAGEEGRCVVTYWNGNFFSHAIMNYYKKNEDLCGSFDLKKHVDWEARTLVTPTKYCTEWHTPAEVQQLLRAYDVDVTKVSPTVLPGTDHLNCDGLSIFVWFSHASTSLAKGYYDSDDAQKFYNAIWGEETVHLGRYDLISDEDRASLSKHQQIAKAQDLHEQQFLNHVRAKFAMAQDRLRVVDFGCGFGGLLRRMWESNLVWSAVGCDISSRMCAQARRLNQALGCDKDIEILEESYLDVSMPDESADLVISMDALLHVGPERQRRAIQEAARILRPGGWMIFTDIMQAESVDRNEMQPIYDRIHLSEMGTVSNYRSAMEEAGFSKFEQEMHSANVSSHYGTIHEVLMEKGDSVGLSAEYSRKMETGLRMWRDLAPKNIVWGFLMAQKTSK